MPTSVHDREHGPADLAKRVLRASLDRGRGLFAAIGLVLLTGLAIAAVALWGFVELAEEVLEGETRAFDRAVLRWVEAHATPWIDRVAIEVTALGETLVLTLLTVVSALLLRLGGHRLAAWLMVAAFGGGAILNTALKLLIGRERPDVFSWKDEYAGLSSFPSAHAMLSMVTYATLAWLIVQLGPPRWARVTVPVVAAFLILLIGISRLFLGVHYPSDVLAGYAAGFVWATACAATMAASRARGDVHEGNVNEGT